MFSTMMWKFCAIEAITIPTNRNTDNTCEGLIIFLVALGKKCANSPVSDGTGIVIAQTLINEVIERMVKAGVEPPVFVSSNLDGGDEKNAHLYEKYYGYWK